MLILLMVALVIVWLIHLLLNQRIIREAQLQQHQMMPRDIAQAQRMFKRQWYRVHPGWRWLRIAAIGLNGLALAATASQVLILAKLVELPQSLITGQMQLVWLAAGAFVIAGVLLAVVMWHYDQMLLSTHKADLYTPPRRLLRTNWWLLMICQCLLAGTAAASTQVQIKEPANNAAVAIDSRIDAANQTVEVSHNISSTAQKIFWQLHIGSDNSLPYSGVEARLGKPSRILALVKSGQLVSGIVTWQHFDNTNQRLTLMFQNDRVVAKLCDRITVRRASKPSVFAVDFALTGTDDKELATRFGGYNWVAGTRDIVWTQFFSDKYTPVDSFNYTFGYTGLTGKRYHASSFTFNMDIQSADDIYSDQPVAKHKGSVDMMNAWYTRMAQMFTQQLQKGSIKTNQVKQGRRALSALD